MSPRRPLIAMPRAIGMVKATAKRAATMPIHQPARRRRSVVPLRARTMPMPSSTSAATRNATIDSRMVTPSLMGASKHPHL